MDAQKMLHDVEIDKVHVGEIISDYISSSIIHHQSQYAPMVPKTKKCHASIAMLCCAIKTSEGHDLPQCNEKTNLLWHIVLTLLVDECNVFAGLRTATCDEEMGEAKDRLR
jgi:hypothetical protein